MRSYLSTAKYTALAMIYSFFIAGCTPIAHQSNNKVAAVAKDKVFNYPYTEKQLPNGLKVVLVKTQYPNLVSLYIPVSTGSRNEMEPGKSGFAHFFEHMMFRGTKKYPSDKYGEILKNLGADQNAYTTDDYTNYHTTFVAEGLETMLELEADRFQNLEYSEADFKTESLAVKGEYLKNASNPVRKIFEVMRDKAFIKHTYKHTTMGYLKDINDMPNQFEYGKKFFKRWYSPENTSIIVVGDFDEAKAMKWIEKYWSNWKPSNYKADIPVEPEHHQSEYVHITWDKKTQPWLAIGFHGPAYDPSKIDMPAIDILATQYFSPSSELYQKLVTKERVVDQLFASFGDHKDPGLLIIGARLTDDSQMSYVKQQITETLAKARNEAMSDTELSQLKSNLKYRFINSLDNSEAIASSLASTMHFKRDPEAINKLYNTYEKLNPAQIKEIANRYFTNGHNVTVTLSQQKEVANFSQQLSLDEEVAKLQQDRKQYFKIVNKTNTSPLIDINLMFKTGSIQDPEHKKGLAMLTAQMLTDAATKNTSYAEIKKTFYPIAGSFSAQVGKEVTTLTGRVHQDNFAHWYPLVKEMLLKPGFLEEDLKRIKAQTINAIRSNLRANNDEELAKEVLYQNIYPNPHPYHSLNYGVISDLEKITLEDIQSFYQNNYTQKNLTLGISGHLAKSDFKTLQSDLSQLPAGSDLNSTLPSPAAIDGRQVTIIEKNSDSVAVSFGFPINLNRSDKDWVALWLVRSWLGEHRNSNSYLYQRIREARGKNYGDYAYIEYFPNGMFLNKPNANFDRSQQIFQVWLRPLRNNNDALFATRTALFEMNKLIDNGITEQAFEATRQYLDKYVALLTENQSRDLAYAMDSEFYQIPNFVNYVREGLKKLTLSEVNRVIKTNMQTDNMQMVYISKEPNELKQTMISNQISPIQYISPKERTLLDEDKMIESLPLNISEDHIQVIPVDTLFE